MVSICPQISVRLFFAEDVSYDKFNPSDHRPIPGSPVACLKTDENTDFNKKSFLPGPVPPFASYRTRAKSADTFFSENYEGVDEKPGLGPMVRGVGRHPSLHVRNAYTDKIEKMLVQIFERVVYGKSTRPTSELIALMLTQFPDSKPEDFAQVCTLCSKKIEQLESNGMASLYIVGTSLKACHLDTTKRMKEVLKEHVMNELRKAMVKKARIEKELHESRMMEESCVYPRAMLVPFPTTILRCEIQLSSPVAVLLSPKAISSP
jgi:hypothetical protein